MHTMVAKTYQKFAEKYEMKGPFLEVGAGAADQSILSGDYFLSKPDRFATNLSVMEVMEEPEADKIQFVRCNANDMRDVFADGQFGTVLCNAMIEHDKYFWRSLDEMKRVLAPGGILAIGAPGYVARRHLKEDINNDKLNKATLTLDVHSTPDYWRFSRMAFKEVICEGLELLELSIVSRIPVIVAVARKPLTGLLEPVSQEDRVKVLAQEKEIKKQQREIRLKAREAEEAAFDPAAATPEELEARQVRLAKREARLQEHSIKLQQRDERKQERAAKTATDDGDAAVVAPDAAKPRQGKAKQGREQRKIIVMDDDDDDDAED
jgi:SAM-dependent methyltransferase